MSQNKQCGRSFRSSVTTRRGFEPIGCKKKNKKKTGTSPVWQQRFVTTKTSNVTQHNFIPFGKTLLNDSEWNIPTGTCKNLQWNVSLKVNKCSFHRSSSLLLQSPFQSSLNLVLTLWISVGRKVWRIFSPCIRWVHTPPASLTPSNRSHVRPSACRPTTNVSLLLTPTVGHKFFWIHCSKNKLNIFYLCYLRRRQQPN